MKKMNMYRELTCTKKTSLVLHTEDYINAGLKQEEMMKAIEDIDGIWNIEKYPINSNIKIHIQGHSNSYIDNILSQIKMVFELMIMKKYKNE